MNFGHFGRRAFFTASLTLPAVLGAGCTPAGLEETAPDQHEATMKKMLEAIKATSYEDYVAPGGPKVKAISRPNFATMSGHLGPILQRGYTTRLLSRLRKDDHELFLWKVDVPAGKEDFELRMSIANGIVDGVWII